jgi:cyclic beta-1,2-glucan synthetase
VIAFAMLNNGDKAHELFVMLNPLTHGSTRTGVYRFRVEPYVAVADVYSEPPHTGRGGWSWYTGSAGWLYQAGVEHILGFAVQGNHLRLDPCIPSAWRAFDITYRYGTARYEIAVTNPNGVMRGIIGLELDGEPLPVAEKRVPLQDDGSKHVVRLTMGSAGEWK